MKFPERNDTSLWQFPQEKACSRIVAGYVPVFFRRRENGVRLSLRDLSIDVPDEMFERLPVRKRDGAGRADRFAPGAEHNAVVRVGYGHFRFPDDLGSKIGLTGPEDSGPAEIGTCFASVTQFRIDHGIPGYLFTRCKQTLLFS